MKWLSLDDLHLVNLDHVTSIETEAAEEGEEARLAIALMQLAGGIEQVYACFPNEDEAHGELLRIKDWLADPDSPVYTVNAPRGWIVRSAHDQVEDPTEEDPFLIDGPDDEEDEEEEDEEDPRRPF